MIDLSNIEIYACSMSDYFRTQAVGENKRSRTRGLLIDTAIDVFSAKGIEAASVQEIAAVAGLANGTFYNHFKDKDDLAGCVSDAILLEISKRLDEQMKDLDQGLIRFTVGSWAFLRIAVATGEWASVLAAQYQRNPTGHADVFRYMRADVEMGVTQAGLAVEVDNFLLEQLAALMVSALQRQLQVGLQLTLMQRVCEHMLRVLGLTPSQAQKVFDKAALHPLVAGPTSLDARALTLR